VELGLYTFGDLVPDPHTGLTVSAVERMDQMLAMARRADDLGLDVFGVGEHHQLRYVNSATATTLSALAAVTETIRLTSATTLLSTADPVRTYQEFATADLVSHGRVELIFGRGALTDNFGLFGFDLRDYDALFMEKLGLFEALNSDERVTWSGRSRPPLNNAEIAPRAAQPRLPATIGAGSPQSAMRAGALGYPLALPMLGGTIAGYGATAAAYRSAFRPPEAGDQARVAVFSHLVVDEDPDFADRFLRYYSAYLEPLFKGPVPRESFNQMLSPEGGLVGGTVQQVVDKILAIREATGCTRYVGQIDIGGQPFDRVMRGIELFATEVAPAVRKACA
jgi:alkanesulfonate monooxygenase SsuD/methylene tetrahydromethanopterin reductase-like flavin-dependent oxidoreductase (luciferase family)